MELDKLKGKGVIAVWGIGYLGFSTIWRLQRQGFFTLIWVPDHDNAILQGLLKGDYPGKSEQSAWSNLGYLPQLRLERLKIAESVKELFQSDISLHIIAIPNRIKNNPSLHIWEQIADYFASNHHSDKKTYIILTAAPTPGDTKEFIRRIARAKGTINVATAFRTDWIIEEYFNKEIRQAIGCDPSSMPEFMEIFEHLGIRTVPTGSCNEAEIYHVCRSSISYLVSAFYNQLAMAYPAINFMKISKALSDESMPLKLQPSLGIGGSEKVTAFESVISGSAYSEILTILREAIASTLSQIVTFAEFFKRVGIPTVGILGITPIANNTDLILSPSLVLAESLIKNDVEVFIHDPLFPSNSLQTLLPQSKILNIEGIKKINKFTDQDALVLMVAHCNYREFTQEYISHHIDGQAGILIDNTNIFSRFKFKKTRYLQIGDGSFNINSDSIPS